MSQPPVPPVADADRYALYTPNGVATAVADVPFPVYGDASDIRVFLDGNELGRELWALVSASGSPIETLSQPLTDGRVAFSPPVVGATLEIIGEIHPRQASMPTAPGIGRREFNQLVGYITSFSRELWRKNKLFQSQPFGFDAAGPLANRVQYDDKPEGFRFAQTDDAQQRPILYVKLSAAHANWSQGMSFRGPQGIQGVSGGGTVTSVGSGFGLKGGPIAGAGSLAIDQSAFGVGLRNRLMNGAMAIDQRRAGAAMTLAVMAGVTNYCVDRWNAYLSSAGSGITAQRTLIRAGAVDYALRLQRAAGSSTTSVINLIQAIETQQVVDLQGKKATFHFKARTGANFSGTSGQLNFSVSYGTGTDQSSASFAAGSWTGQTLLGQSNVAPVLGGSFVAGALTVDIPATATQIGVRLWWTPTGTAGAADYIDVTEAQFELGAIAIADVAFERRPIALETVLCQRFFRKSYAQSVAPGTNVGDGGGGVNGFYGAFRTGATFGAPMRAAPTLTIYDNSGNIGAVSYFDSNTSSWVHATALSSSGANDQSMWVKPSSVTNKNDASFDFVAVAEL